MLKTDQFYLKFRWNLLLTFFSGTFIPGMHTLLPKHFPALLIFSAFFIGFSFNGIEHCLTVFFFSNELDSVTIFLLNTCSLLCFGAILESVYMIFRRNELKCLISMWCNFQPELWPELREIVLKKHLFKIQKMARIFLSFRMVPSAAFFAFMVYKRQLALASIMAIQSAATPRWAVFMQCFGVWCWIFRYTMLSCFFSMVFRLILVELEYVELCLEKVFDDLRMYANGFIYRIGKILFSFYCWLFLHPVFAISDDEEIEEILPEDYKKSCRFAEERLCTLIRYHQKILRFSHKVDEIFGWLFVIQFYFLSTASAILVFGSSTNSVATELRSLFAFGVTIWFHLLFLACSIGDEVTTKSTRFINAAFYKNWMAYPVRIQKLLMTMMAIATQRPIAINTWRILPVNRETFYLMVSIQYKFYRFIVDTQKNNLKH